MGDYLLTNYYLFKQLEKMTGREYIVVVTKVKKTKDGIMLDEVQQDATRCLAIHRW